MILESLSIIRMTYGPNVGRLQGDVKFKSPSGEVKLVLGDEVSQRILNVCADGVVAASRAVAEDLRSEVLTQTALLENA